MRLQFSDFDHSHYSILCLLPSQPGPWETLPELFKIFTMMAIQEIEDQLHQSFKSLGKLKENNQFLFSCISEGMIPSGLKLNFNLAKYVNDETFVNNIKAVIDNANSRLLDLVFERNVNEENSIHDKLNKRRCY